MPCKVMIIILLRRSVKLALKQRGDGAGVRLSPVAPSPDKFFGNIHGGIMLHARDTHKLLPPATVIARSIAAAMRRGDLPIPAVAVQCFRERRFFKIGRLLQAGETTPLNNLHHPPPDLAMTD